MSYYVIIRGPLGIGKTTISGALAKTIGGVVVSIDKIADRNWDGGSVHLYVNANKVAAKQARIVLAGGTPVIFDGCFYWKTQIEDLEKRLPFPHEVFTLKAPVSVCIKRDSGRKVVFGPEAAEQVYRKVTRFGYGVAIDATQAIPATVREMRSYLSRGVSSPRIR